tara:strand:- start:338 stop:478 length:141 start_codon:yes stop_codon:yes gene_type:complete
MVPREIVSRIWRNQTDLLEVHLENLGLLVGGIEKKVGEDSLMLAVQ